MLAMKSRHARKTGNVDVRRKAMTKLVSLASSLSRKGAASILELALVFGLVTTVSTAQTYTDLHHCNCANEGCNPRLRHRLTWRI